MLILTVKDLRIIDCEHDAAKRNESYRKEQEETHVGLPIYQSIKINIQKWQMVPELMQRMV